MKERALDLLLPGFMRQTGFMGLYKDAWDAAAWDTQKKESQWDCLGRIVRERDPQKIGINGGEIQWAVRGLTFVLKKRLVEAIGPKYAARLESAEPLPRCGARHCWTERLISWSRPLHSLLHKASRNFSRTPLKNKISHS